MWKIFYKYLQNCPFVHIDSSHFAILQPLRSQKIQAPKNNFENVPIKVPSFSFQSKQWQNIITFSNISLGNPSHTYVSFKAQNCANEYAKHRKKEGKAKRKKIGRSNRKLKKLKKIKFKTATFCVLFIFIGIKVWTITIYLSIINVQPLCVDRLLF